MEPVHVIYGHDPEVMVRRLVEAARVLDGVRPDQVVVIKPNLVVSRREWVGVDTDPRVVVALVKVLKERGAHRITVADGSGMGYSATKAFQYCGYGQVAKEYGFQLVDLERDRFVTKKTGIDGPFESLEIAQTVLDCDVLINVPIMKAHAETLITCSLKNLKGVMPRQKKTAFHRTDLHRGIAQLAGTVKPDLILVDGLQGDLSSETGHDPVAMETMLLGKHPVEVDSVVADMLGYSPRMIRHIAHSADAGLGTCDLSKIKIRSLNHPSMKRHFKPAVPLSGRFPCRMSSEGACCTCLGNLAFALERLNQQGILSKKHHFLVGPKVQGLTKTGELTFAIGRCAAEKVDARVRIDRCPPTARAICSAVLSALRPD